MKRILSILILFASFGINAQTAQLPTTPKTVTIELSRPTNTAAYAALDAISNSVSGSTLTTPVCLTLTPVSTASQSVGYITKALLATDQVTCTARFRLHLFTATVTPLGDNDAYTSLYANNSIALGYIDFAAASTEGAGSTKAVSLNSTIKFPFRITVGKAIYGLLETLDVFTPTSGQKFFIQLTVDSN